MKLKNFKKIIKKKDLKHKTNKYICNFQQFETIKSFFDSTYTGKIDIDEAEEDQNNNRN